MADTPETTITADIASLLVRARMAYAAMSPVDRALHDTGQRRSLVRSMGHDPGPDVLADEVRRLRKLVIEMGGNPYA